MDTTLVTVTVLSMAMAATLSVIVWRLLRDERQRSEARIAALMEASRLDANSAGAATPPSGGTSAPDAVRPEPARPGVFRSDVFRPVAPRIEPAVSAAPDASERQRVEGRRTPPARQASNDLPLHSVPTAPVAANAMFVEPQQASPWGNRLAVMAGLAMFGTAVVLVALTAAKTRAAAPAAQPASAPAAAAEPAARGLELLSLRDARQDDTLTITGTVQNPRTGPVLSRVAVTAYAFDDTGAFLASGRALIDVTSLAPGDESPFLVTVPVTGAVARYRIGFRSEDGRVIAHVDKRQQTPMAALRQPNG